MKKICGRRMEKGGFRIQNWGWRVMDWGQAIKIWGFHHATPTFNTHVFFVLCHESRDFEVLVKFWHFCFFTTFSRSAISMLQEKYKRWNIWKFCPSPFGGKLTKSCMANQLGKSIKWKVRGNLVNECQLISGRDYVDFCKKKIEILIIYRICPQT